jgi:hypothetical protein
MGQNLLNTKEIKFIRSCQKWNGKFETLFAALFVLTILLPLILMMTMDLPGLQSVFANARMYTFSVCLGWLVTFLNERWIRIVNKLIKLDAF